MDGIRTRQSVTWPWSLAVLLVKWDDWKLVSEWASCHSAGQHYYSDWLQPTEAWRVKRSEYRHHRWWSTPFQFPRAAAMPGTSLTCRLQSGRRYQSFLLVGCQNWLHSAPMATVIGIVSRHYGSWHFHSEATTVKSETTTACTTFERNQTETNIKKYLHYFFMTGIHFLQLQYRAFFQLQQLTHSC